MMRITDTPTASAPVLLSAPLCSSLSAKPAAAPQERVPTKAEADGNLLLKNYAPRTKLEVKRTRIESAKCPGIDVHFHMDSDAMPSIWHKP